MIYTVGTLLLIACAILVGLFALQHCGTHKVAFMFAPIVIIWLLSIFSIGLYNIIHWNPSIIRAISPHYVIKFLQITGKDGWLSLGGVLLAITGMWNLELLYMFSFVLLSLMGLFFVNWKSLVLVLLETWVL